MSSKSDIMGLYSNGVEKPPQHPGPRSYPKKNSLAPERTIQHSFKTRPNLIQHEGLSGEPGEHDQKLGQTWSELLDLTGFCVKSKFQVLFFFFSTTGPTHAQPVVHMITPFCSLKP